MKRDMKRSAIGVLVFLSMVASLCSLPGCKEKHADAAAEAPPAAKVVPDVNVASWAVDNPSKYPVVTAQEYDAPSQLQVTGSVNPDIAREIPVVSLASGRVVDIKARLDDNVKKGQLLLKIQSPDSTAAFDTYLKAVNDERMNNKEYVRSQELYGHGAISLTQLEQAEDAEKDSQADLKAAEETLETLGVDKQHPSPVVPVYSPISGVIVQQNVTQAAAAGVTFSGSATAFTIADLSTVWIICDVYENDISSLALGQKAKIQINAYPDLALTGRISDIGPVLDPNIRTAKVRIEVQNPGKLRVGMFATATFEGLKKEVHTVVPATAILHLHDRDWIYTPAPGKKFQRLEVVSGQPFPNNMLEVTSGLRPGQQVVENVLALQNEIDNQ